jgi:hypothetical protein
MLNLHFGGISSVKMQDFTLRRHQSQPIKSKRESFVISKDGSVSAITPNITRSFSTKILRRLNSKRKSRPFSFVSSKSFKVLRDDAISPIDETLKRTQSRRERFSFVLANPDTLFQQKNASDTQLHIRYVPSSTYNLTNSSNTTHSFILRTLFSPKVDFAPMPTVYRYKSTIEPDQPMFDVNLLPDSVLNNLPNGFIMRPLCPSDYSRGFLEVLRVSGKMGYVSNQRWEERCEYLKQRAERGEEYVVVVIDEKPDRVVGVGRWTGEKGL